MNDMLGHEIKNEELDKLYSYLVEHGYYCKRIIPGASGFKNVVVVFSDPEMNNYLWDAVCHYGSYGYEEGRLEIMGDTILTDDEKCRDSVAGWLTADDIIQRLEKPVSSNNKGLTVGDLLIYIAENDVSMSSKIEMSIGSNGKPYVDSFYHSENDGFGILYINGI